MGLLRSALGPAPDLQALSEFILEVGYRFSITHRPSGLMTVIERGDLPCNC